MRAVIFDTETTGLFDWSKPADDDCQPRMCSLSATLVDAEGRPIQHINHYVLPDNWSVHVRDPRNHAEAFAVNGLSLEFLEANGSPIEEVLQEFDRLVDDCELIAGYAVSFDQKVVRGEQRRAGRPDRYGERPTFDVMHAVKAHLGVKSIKLADAVRRCLEREPTDSHDARGDVTDTIALYTWCIERRLVVPKKQESKS